MNLENLKNAKTLVIGDVMLDTYYKGNVKRISPEAPVPVVRVNNQFDSLGGAANVCRNLHGIGSKTYLIGCVGKDQKSEIVTKKLNELAVEHTLLPIDYPTINKIRVVGNQQQIVRIDFEEEKMILTPEQQDEITRFVSEQISHVDCVVISDYGKGFCTEKICQHVIETANKHNKTTIIDQKGRDWEKYKHATIITLNLKNLSEVAGKEINNNDVEISAVAEQLFQKYNYKNILITRSGKGMTLVNKDIIKHIPTEAKEVFDISGAGDTVVAVLAACLSAQFSLYDSVVLANKAAGIVVGKEGTVPVTYEELLQIVSKETVSSKIINQANLTSLLENLRSKNKKIVFTNGVFDIIHRGHISYLQKAKQLGDILILGLNTDSSVKRIKGEGRPINNENDRAFVLSAYEFVDYIVMFSDDTPQDLIKAVQPNVLVKGADYKIEEVIGREFAKETILIDFQEGYSSTTIINKTNKK